MNQYIISGAQGTAPRAQFGGRRSVAATFERTPAYLDTT